MSYTEAEVAQIVSEKNQLLQMLWILLMSCPNFQVEVADTAVTDSDGVEMFIETAHQEVLPGLGVSGYVLKATCRHSKGLT